MYTEVKEITRTLPVPLTERETEDYTKRMIAGLDKKESLDADLKFYRETIKGQQASQDNIITECKEVLKAGTLPKVVKCEKIYDYQSGTVTVVRLDTAEVWRPRP